MKYFAPLLAIAMLPFAIAAAGTFSVTGYSSGECASNSGLQQTVSGTQAFAAKCLPLTSPMASFVVIMGGGCNVTTFYFDNACSNLYGSDVGSGFNVGCQTFSAGSFGSFKVTC